MTPLNVTVRGTTFGYQPVVTIWKTHGARWAASGGLRDEHILETSLPGSFIAGPPLGTCGRKTMDHPTSVGAPMKGLPFTEGRTSRRIIIEEFIPDVVSLLWHWPLMQGGRS